MARQAGWAGRQIIGMIVMDFMVMDSHTHVWPDAIADRALSAVPALTRVGDGTVAGLTEAMADAGVERVVCLGVSPTADRVAATNRFLGNLDRDRFVGFGSIHPGLTPEQNVASLRDNGLRGAKVHPIFQNYSLADPSLLATLDAMRGEFPVIIHVGAGGRPQDTARCTPALLANLVRQLPGLDVVACHLGGFGLLDDAADEVIGLPVHLDTAWPPSVSQLDRRRVRELIRRHGPDRVLFASDWPMADIRAEVDAVHALELDAEETEMVLGSNLERLLAQ